MRHDVGMTTDSPLSILVIPGALRARSMNRALAHAAVSLAPTGTTLTVHELHDIPLYDGDAEAAGVPASVTALREAIAAADALFFCTPEYNSSVPGVLKNAIDWASRPAPGEGSLAAFAGKTAVLMATSPGALGGLRGLVHLRSILGNIQMLVLPEQRAIPKAHEAFAANGSLKDAKLADEIRGLGRRLAEVTRALQHG